MLSQVIYQLRLPGDCKLFTFKCSVKVTIKKGLFVDAESVRKNCKWEIVNLTTTNAILMKLTTIMYLHESVNRKALRTRNSFLWLNFIASLVKLLYKLDDIWESIPWKTTQILLKFKIIKVHLRSFWLFSAHLKAYSFKLI